MRFAKQPRSWAMFAAFAALVFLTACQPGGRRSEGEPNYLVITQTDPTLNSQNAYLDQSIVIQFNQDIDPNTVNEGTVQVSGPSGTVNGTYQTNFSQVIFTPLVNFTTNTSYTVTVPGWSSNPFCVLSMKGDGLLSAYVLSFQTGTQYTPDTDPPSVTAIYVSDGSSNLVSLPIDNSTSVTLDVSPATSVIVEFDEGMNPSTFVPGSLSLIDQNNSTVPLGGTYRFFNKNTRVVFYPNSGVGDGFLSVSSNYQLIITSALQDDSLNPGPNSLAPAPISVAFRTRAIWNSPSTGSPFTETFSTQNMLDQNNTNAIWNSAPTGQRLEGGYGAAALAGSGIDGDFTPTQATVLNTTTRPFGFQYVNVNIPSGVTVTLTGSNPAIIRAQGNMTIAGAVISDGNSGVGVTGFNVSGGPGGSGGAGGFNGGSGNPANASASPWRSDPGGGPSAGQGGVWSFQAWSGPGTWPFTWLGNTGEDIPGSGGGGGNSTAGGPGVGSNVTGYDGTGGGTNTSGNPAVTNYTLSDGGGSGGGGGGGSDDDPNNALAGDGALNFPFDDGAAGGGGGGGVINLTCAATVTISGTIRATGGSGGTAPTNGWGHTSGGVGGGGGSGGCILVQGLTVNITGGTFDVRGGTGGVGGYTGGFGMTQYVSRGGAGGDGWLRFESVSGTIMGESGANRYPSTAPSYSTGTLNISTTQGQSLFFDTGVEDPDFVDNSNGGFNVNLVLNSGTVQIFVQGAEADSRGEPDTQTYWPNDSLNANPSWAMAYDSTNATNVYTGNINQVDRYRFIRFRIVFGNLLNVYPPGPYVTDVTFPFRD